MKRLGLIRKATPFLASLWLVSIAVLPSAWSACVTGTANRPPAAKTTARDTVATRPTETPGVVFDNYRIKISPSRDSMKIAAVAEFDVVTNYESGIDSFSLYLHDELKVDSVWSARGGRLEFTQAKVSCPISYSLGANKVIVKLAEKLQRADTLGLVVSYHGKFTSSPVRTASDFMRFESAGLFLRGPGWSLWFPIAATTTGEPSVLASMKVDVVAPVGWKALCEGESSLERAGELWSFGWDERNKIPIGSAVLFASNYDTLSVRVGGQRLSFWYFSSAEDSIASVNLFGVSRELVGFFEQNYGDPQEVSSPPRFTMVEAPMYGDFFSGTIMGISTGRVREAVSSRARAELSSLIASCMVRKFTVPEVDSSAPGAPFLLESVPSYAYVPAIEKTFGKQFVRESSLLVMHRYAAARKKAESQEAGFSPEKPLGELSLSEMQQYRHAFLLEGRGAYVLHMLRKIIGDESFYLAIRSYRAAFAERPSIHRRARIEDFMQIAEAASGKRLDWFFSEWLYGDALPDYRITDVRTSASHDTTFVDVTIENAGTGLMPVSVALFTDKGQRSNEIWIAAHETARLRFVSRSKPKRVEIDPEKWILQADTSNDGADINPPEPSGK